MADRKFRKQMWIPLMIGFVFAGLAFWLSSGADVGSPAGDKATRTSGPDEDTVSAGAHEVEVPALRIAVGRRLTISQQDLPSEGSLAIALDMADVARGTGRRRARIVSETAGRLDTEAVPLAGVNSGLRLEIGQDYLARGIYMIEIETVDSHPLRFRRYVLEIE